MNCVGLNEFKEHADESKSNLPYYGRDDVAMNVGVATALPFFSCKGIFPL